MGSRKPLARYVKRLNGHTLSGERWSEGWYWTCRSFPELAMRHTPCEDSAAVVAEFEELAKTQAPLPGKKVG